MSWLNRLFNNNRFLMVLSFLLAVVIWFVVSVVYSPETSRTIAGVPVEFNFSDELAGYRAFSASELFAKVEIKGKKYVVEQLSAEDIMVSASVDSITGSGMYTLDLTAKKRVSSGDYTVTTLTPSVNVMVDAYRTMKLPVEIICEGATIPEIKETNQNLLLEPTFMQEDQQTVTISGPETQVSKIAYATAVATVNEELTQSKQFHAGLLLHDVQGNVLYDANNKISTLNFVTLSYETTQIMANVNLRKTVPLKFATAGAPTSAPSVSLREVTGSQTATDTQVNSVVIKGAMDVISKIDHIVLDGTVDFTQIDPAKPESFQFKLQLPSIAGVMYDEYTNLTDLYFVATVTNPHVTSRSFDIPANRITVQNLPSQYTATVQSALKGVVIVGPADSVRSLSVSGLQVVVDASSVSATGAANLNAKIVITGSRSCWVQGSYQVVVETTQK